MYLSDGRRKHPPVRRRVRHRKVVAALLVAACVLAPLAISAVWLRSQVLDTNAYVKTVTPLSSNPAIAAAVADEVVKALFTHVDVNAEAERVLPKKAQFLALPLTAGLRGYTGTAVERFLATSEFRRLWQVANTQAHDALLAALDKRRSPYLAPDGSVDIDLAGVVVAARQALAQAGLHLFDKVKPKLLQRRFVVARPSSIDRIRRVVTILKALAIALPVVSALCFALALGLSRERRRTVLRAGAGVAATAAVTIAAIVVMRTYYLHRVVGPDVPLAAAGALYDVLVRNLRLQLKLVCLGGLAVAGAAALAGPSPFAVRTRTWALRTAGKLADEAVGESVTARWVATNKATLRTVTVVFALLLLLSAAHPNVRLLVKLTVGALLVLGALEILGRPASPGRRKAK